MASRRRKKETRRNAGEKSSPVSGPMSPTDQNKADDLERLSARPEAGENLAASPGSTQGGTLAGHPGTLAGGVYGREPQSPEHIPPYGLVGVTPEGTTEAITGTTTGGRTGSTAASRAGSMTGHRRSLEPSDLPHEPESSEEH